MEHVRYRVATTSMRNKSSGYETPTAVVSSRVAPSTGESENSYHPGRRQRSRRRDVYAAPDDFVRVSAMSPPPADTVRRRIDRTSDFHVQSPTSYWAQPAYATPDSRAVQARSRSRPRPAPPLLHELGVQRDYGPPRDSANSSRYQEQQMTEESRHRQRQRQRQQQQQQHVAPSLIPSPNFTTPRSAIDYRPQVSMTTTTPSLLPGRTFTSLPAPPGPVSSSPSYMNDNKALLKEALISAAAAKLSRSSSARSAVVRPLVVIRNGPAKSSSDEDVDDVVTTATTSTTEVKSTVSNAYGPESSSTRSVETPVLHTAADVAIATAAAAAAAATRRSRTHRRDVDLVATNVTSVTNSIVVTTGASTVVSAGITSQQVGAGTRSTRAGHRDQTAAGGDGVSLQSRAMPVSALSATSVHDAAAAGLHRATRPMEDAAERSQTTLASSSCDSQHQETVLSTPGVVAADTTHVSFETLNKTPRTRRTVRDNREDLRLSTNKFTPTRNVQLADKPVNDSSVTETAEISSSPVTEAGTLQESPGSTSKVAFIKSLLSRTRSPSPTRCRRGRSKTQHTSPNPSSVKRIGAEVAQRIGAPVKGYLKQLRDRSMSSQRRRAAEPVAAASTKTTQEESEPVTAPCQSRGAADCLTRPSDVLSSSAESAASSDDRTADDMSGGRGRRFRAERRNQDHNSGSSNSSTPALTSQWKSTSELTTPMSRLDNLLKANSMQHLQAAAAAASTTTGASQTIVETSGNTARAASSTLAPSSPPALTNKTSQSTGCLLSSSADRSLTPQFEHQRTTPTTTMTRCYLEKPPRAARRAVTVQLDRRLVDASSLASTERQSTSQADLRTVDEVPATSSDVSNRQSAAQRSITSSATSTSSAAASCRHGATTSSQNERDLRELYEQKRLERQLEEKLALMEKERAGVIAKLWSQIDHQNSATTQPQRRTPAPAAGSDHSQNSTSTFGLVLPLSDDAASPTGSNSQVLTDDPLGDLLIELSSTPTSSRWSERRRAGRSATVALRPRAASCSRHFVSDNTATAADVALTAKSLSHTQLYRKPSNASDVSPTDNGSALHVRHRSHQQLLQPTSAARPLTCYLPVRDRDVDLRRFIEAAGHRLDQCEHVQLTASTCHGYLSKLSAGAAVVRQWKRRWFVFDRAQRCLQYYADQTEKRSEGAFVWFQTIQDVFVDHERRSRSPHPESTFCVKTVERPLFLVAPTPEAMRIWIDVIFTGAEGYRQFLDS